jgi:hypothetical protein
LFVISIAFCELCPLPIYIRTAFDLSYITMIIKPLLFSICVSFGHQVWVFWY